MIPRVFVFVCQRQGVYNSNLIMDFKELIKKAGEIKEAYDKLDRIKGKEVWMASHYAQGLVGDVGDLLKLVMAKNNYSNFKDVDKRIRHELADCLWSIFMLSVELNVDLEKEFIINIEYLKQKLNEET